MYHHLNHRSRARQANSLPSQKPGRWLTLGLLVLISACSTNEPSAAPESAPLDDAYPGVTAPVTVEDMSDRKNSTSSSEADVTGDSVPPELMQRLVNAVALEAGADVSAVKLRRAEKTTYRDSSLDCPEPNMAYAQVLVDGYWVVFHVGSEEFDMRVTDQGKFLRCTGSTKRPPIPYDDT